MPAAPPDTADKPFDIDAWAASDTPDAAPATPPADATQPDAAPAAPAAEAAPAAWNGELDHLDKAAWWKDVPEPARVAFRAGYEQKIGNLERGYQDKYRSVADERKALDEQRKAFAADKQRAEMLAAMYGGDQAQHDAILKELSELRDYRTSTDARLAAEEAARVSAEEKRITESYGDILTHDAAATLLEQLVTGGVPIDQAAAYVRHQHQLTAPAAQPPPGGTQAQDTASRPPSAWDKAARVGGRGDDPPAQVRATHYRPGVNFDAFLESAADRAAAQYRPR